MQNKGQTILLFPTDTPLAQAIKRLNSPFFKLNLTRQNHKLVAKKTILAKSLHR